MIKYNSVLSPSQERILQAAKDGKLNDKTLSQIGSLVDIAHPQTVKYHIDKLVERGMIRVDRKRKTITPITMEWSDVLSQDLLAIPIYGATSAGAATMIAEENLEGYMRVSRSVLGRRTGKNLFALRVVGDSMNKAKLNNMTIDDGDYVIVEKGNDVFDGDIVLSIIDGLANIKYYSIRGDRIILSSKSTSHHPPIVITAADDYIVCGKIIDVVKQ